MERELREGDLDSRDHSLNMSMERGRYCLSPRWLSPKGGEHLADLRFGSFERAGVVDHEIGGFDLFFVANLSEIPCRRAKRWTRCSGSQVTTIK